MSTPPIPIQLCIKTKTHNYPRRYRGFKRITMIPPRIVRIFGNFNQCRRGKKARKRFVPAASGKIVTC
ncbi:unnamed protein product [Amoebophrya sp. A120]|nr:unnamed protein product [Amoebophrya sp. A120]|eukprot:GSA120T00004793001.1